MAFNEFGIKELENVTLKSTYSVKVGNRDLEPGEVIASFDKIQLANLRESKTWISANGGYKNTARVIWETSQNIDISFAQGIFNENQFAVLYNGNLRPTEDGAISVSYSETLESNENNIINLKYEPDGPVFIYDIDTGEKIKKDTSLKREIDIGNPYKTVYITYTCAQKTSTEIIQIGSELLKGFLTLEGTVRVKDDITGQIRTGVLKIPKLKLMSSLTMRLGASTSPMVGAFNAVGYPVGSRGSEYVMEITFLDSVL